MTDDQKAPSASLATGDDLTPGSWADFVARLRHDCVGKGVEDHYTADAIFIVQARRRIYGIDSDYTDKQCVIFDGTCWHSPEEYWGDLEDDEKRELDEKADDEFGSAFLSLDERDQWRCLAELPEHTVTGWDETWEYVNSHFTKDAAEAFIRRKKHDYRGGLRVYVDAQLYCWEYNAIKAAILDGRIGPKTPPTSAVPDHPDDAAVDRFAAAMKAKLAKKRDEGRGGWENKTQCSQELLSNLLREHVTKGDPLDVANLAMMLHQRGESIAQPDWEQLMSLATPQPEPTRAVPEVFKALHARLKAMPGRVEPIGGQLHSYIQKDEALGWVEHYAAKQPEPTSAVPEGFLEGAESFKSEMLAASNAMLHPLIEVVFAVWRLSKATPQQGGGEDEL